MPPDPAEREQARLHVIPLHGGGDDRPPGTFDLLRRWQAFLEADGRVNAHTRTQYRRAIVRFLADVLIEITDVTEDDVVNYIVTLGPNGGGRGDMMRALKSFYRWGTDRELVARDPVAKLRIPRAKYAEAPALSPEQLEDVLTAAESVDPRARPTLELAYATGARVASLAGIMPEDVDLAKGWIRFRVAKYGDAYGVPLGDRGRRAA